MTNYRQKKINKNVKKALAEIICYDVRDDMVSEAMINKVEVSPDLYHASIYYSILNPNNKKQVAEAIEKANKYIRYKLAQKMDMRKTPNLHFRYDDTEVEALKLEEVIEAERDRNE